LFHQNTVFQHVRAEKGEKATWERSIGTAVRALPDSLGRGLSTIVGSTHRKGIDGRKRCQEGSPGVNIISETCSNLRFYKCSGGTCCGLGTNLLKRQVKITVRHYPRLKSERTNNERRRKRGKTGKKTGGGNGREILELAFESGKEGACVIRRTRKDISWVQNRDHLEAELPIYV